MKTHADLEQSKKLAEILPVDTADMTWLKADRPVIGLDLAIKANLFSYRNGYILPCWSLSALLNVLPKVYGLKPILDLEENSICYSGSDLYVIADNPVDACYEMIVKLHEFKIL